MSGSDWILTTGEVLRLLKVSRASVKRWGAAGKLPSIAVGSGQRLYRLVDVEEFLKERQCKRKRGGSKRRTKRSTTNN